MKRKVLTLVVLILSIFLGGCSNKKDVKPDILYDQTKSPFQNKLMKYEYDSNNEIVDSIYVYLIKGSEENLNFTKYTVSKDDGIALNIKKDEKFIISLPSNSTVGAKWIFKIDESLTNSLVLEKEEWLNTFKPIPKNSTGVCYGRQFFEFKALNLKSGVLNFQYAPNENFDKDTTDNYFKFKININIL